MDPGGLCSPGLCSWNNYFWTDLGLFYLFFLEAEKCSYIVFSKNENWDLKILTI